MTILRQITDGFSHWMECVAAGIVAVLGWLTASRRVHLVQQANGSFALKAAGGKSWPPVTVANGVARCSADAAAILKGNEVELVMRPENFFFRPLELPRRASEFLEGIVRAQVDRVTPWTASQAVVGWSEPTDAGNDKISVTVVAAPRVQIVPVAQAIDHLGVKSVFVSTTLPDSGAGAAAIKVFEQSAAGKLETRRVRRKLVAVLAGLALLAVSAAVADVTIGGALQDRLNDTARRIAERRGIIRAGNDAASNSALAKLVRRKNQTPADVIVLDALSAVLPDNTYVTELRIEGDKVQIVGITNDAPSLIRLIELSPHFSRATFFAPTTRSPSDPGDRFHIQARANPVFSPQS
jgi:general secretion pathway protein L